MGIMAFKTHGTGGEFCEVERTISIGTDSTWPKLLYRSVATRARLHQL